MENSIQNNNFKNSGRVWSGLIIIILGLGFLLDNMGLDLPNWLFSWSNFLIILGLFVGVRRNFRGIGWLILILVGAYNTLDNIFGRDLDLSKYGLGVGLVILGVFLIFRPKSKSCDGDGFRGRFRSKIKSISGSVNPEQQGAKASVSNDIIDVMAVFGASHQAVYSKNFQGGDITAVFGGADIILTQADFPETVSLDVTAVFGGIKLIVPQNWAVKSNVTAIFGSVEDKRPQLMPTGEIQKTLILDGAVFFGGIEIKSY